MDLQQEMNDFGLRFLFLETTTIDSSAWRSEQATLDVQRSEPHTLTAQKNNVTRTSFFDLPPELRNKTYTFITTNILLTKLHLPRLPDSFATNYCCPDLNDSTDPPFTRESFLIPTNKVTKKWQAFCRQRRRHSWPAANSKPSTSASTPLLVRASVQDTNLATALSTANDRRA